MITMHKWQALVAENEKLKHDLYQSNKESVFHAQDAVKERRRAEKAEALAGEFSALIEGDSTGSIWKRECMRLVAAYAKLKGEV